MAKVTFTKDEKKILCKAASILRVRGHCKEALYMTNEKTGPVCAFGALNAAAQDGYPMWGLKSELVEGIGDRLSAGFLRGTNLALWNNAKKRTASEVIQLFRKVGGCARRAR